MRAPDTELSPQEITKRWLWRLGLLFLFFLAALVATFIIWRLSLSRRIDRTLAAIQKDGYVFSMAQLEQKYYPNFASNENAAPFFLNAFANLYETNDDRRKTPALPDYQSANKSKFLSQTNLELITKLLNDNNATLALLHQSLTRLADFNKMTGFFDRSYAFYLETMLKKLRISQLPFPRRLDAAIQLQNSQEMSRHSNSFPTAFLLLDVSRSDFIECRMNARTKIIRTVLAIERYRLANQTRLPDKLSDLVPAFLGSVPTDPFDGKSIRYKKLPKGYMVYSGGRDRKDDGGVYMQRYKPGAPSDITFVVER